ncbi:hypothetical protein R6Q59_019527 [Mikania micrantha]
MLSIIDQHPKTSQNIPKMEMIVILINICVTFFLILRIKTQLLTLVKHSVSHLFQNAGEDDECLVDLPIIRFEDLLNLRRRSVDRMCFICSKDYDTHDVVCQLSRCGDVFHSDCVGKLIHRKQTYCPCCRTPVFSGL